MRKLLFLIFLLALCVSLYGMSKVYTAVSIFKAAAGISAQPIRNVIDFKTSASQSSLKTCGDPIPDPRPHSIHSSIQNRTVVLEAIPRVA